MTVIKTETEWIVVTNCGEVFVQCGQTGKNPAVFDGDKNTLRDHKGGRLDRMRLELERSYPTVWEEMVKQWYALKACPSNSTSTPGNKEVEPMVGPMTWRDRDELFIRDTEAQERIAAALETLVDVLTPELMTAKENG